MKCSNCLGSSGGSTRVCDACRAMQAEGDWNWELDNGNRRVRCPDCGRALPISPYEYEMPYRFCPWCGKRRVRGEQMRMELNLCAGVQHEDH